jgi:hypothetical protein
MSGHRSMRLAQTLARALWRSTMLAFQKNQRSVPTEPYVELPIGRYSPATWNMPFGLSQWPRKRRMTLSERTFRSRSRTSERLPRSHPTATPQRRWPALLPRAGATTRPDFRPERDIHRDVISAPELGGVHVCSGVDRIFDMLPDTIPGFTRARGGTIPNNW